MPSKVGRRTRWARRELTRRVTRRIALRTHRRAALVGPPGQWEAQRRFQFEFLTSHGLRPTDRLLDIGCGTLRGGIPLIEYLDSGNYMGVEARGEALAEARKELSHSGLAHKKPLLIRASEPREMQPLPFDVAWGFMVLIHMPDAILHAYMRFVSENMDDAGNFYANVALGERHDGEWQGFPVVRRPLDFYRSGASAHGLHMADLGPLQDLGAIDRGGNTTMLRFVHAG